jgi:hypothetical protein
VAMAEADIQCELSYAYLHVIASRIGVECEKSECVSDNHAVDARLHVLERMATDSQLARFSVEVQLKSASRELTENDLQFSYPLPRNQYDHLRATESNSPLILILFVMPHDATEWISQNPEALTTRKCAYWKSLYGANAVTVDKPTIHVPKTNVVSVEGLRSLLGRFSRREKVSYAE